MLKVLSGALMSGVLKGNLHTILFNMVDFRVCHRSIFVLQTVHLHLSCLSMKAGSSLKPLIGNKQERYEMYVYGRKKRERERN